MQSSKTVVHEAPSSKAKTHTGPTHIAYQVADLGEGKKAAWTRVGAAFGHRDGKGFDIKLDALPVDGRIVLRLRDESQSPSNS